MAGGEEEFSNRSLRAHWTLGCVSDFQVLKVILDYLIRHLVLIGITDFRIYFSRNKRSLVANSRYSFPALCKTKIGYICVVLFLLLFANGLNISMAGKQAFLFYNHFARILPVDSLLAMNCCWNLHVWPSYPTVLVKITYIVNRVDLYL